MKFTKKHTIFEDEKIDLTTQKNTDRHERRCAKINYFYQRNKSKESV